MGENAEASDDDDARRAAPSNLVIPGAREAHLHAFFSSFSNWLAKWTGSHWAFSIAAVLVVIGLLTVGVDATNFAISIVVLLMIFVVQNTQNRDSAALHLKLDEMVRAQPEARDEVRGVESRSEREIHELHDVDEDAD